MKYYSLYEGRPAFPPSVDFKLLFLSYLCNISERAIVGLCIHDICDENGFVTNVETIPGNTNEGENLRKLVQEDGISEIVGDALYESGKNLRWLQAKGIKAYIPARFSHYKIDKFIAVKGRLRCSGSKLSIGKIRQGEGWLHYWSIWDCKNCILKEKCLLTGEVRKRVYLSDAKELRINEHKEKYKSLLFQHENYKKLDKFKN